MENKISAEAAAEMSAEVWAEARIERMKTNIERLYQQAKEGDPEAMEIIAKIENILGKKATEATDEDLKNLN